MQPGSITGWAELTNAGRKPYRIDKEDQADRETVGKEEGKDPLNLVSRSKMGHKLLTTTTTHTRRQGASVRLAVGPVPLVPPPLQSIDISGCRVAHSAIMADKERKEAREREGKKEPEE